MSFSIRSIIRGLLAPKHKIHCQAGLWEKGVKELERRGQGRRESGAFLLGRVEESGRRRVERFVYYDELEPRCLDSGIVELTGSGYGPLWDLCRKTGATVVADIHTHPAGASQSTIDKANPIIATKGHIAIIVPNYAQGQIPHDLLGVYEYMGAHQWRGYVGKHVHEFLYIGFWG